MMDFSFMPTEFEQAIKKIEEDKLFEIRLRCGFPVMVNIKGKKAFLTNDGYSLFEDCALVCDDKIISYIIEELTEHSLYAFNDRIKKGYLTTNEGIRVGLAGECVYDDGKLITVKNISSLNIRVPHEVIGCADKIYSLIAINEKIYSTLIVSPPFVGKTTILKDLARILNRKIRKSILIIDERGEFEKISGQFIDKIRYSDKLYALTYGLRSMSPEIIITDELVDKNDWDCAKAAANSGLKIVASCHAENISDLIKKEYFIKGIFDRYIVLNSKNLFGVVKEVSDGDFNRI